MAVATILIVDDEVPQLRALCETLSRLGYETVGVSSGADALKALQGQQFDLILTDLMMPVMDGLSVIRQALEIDPNLVAIMMTGAGTIGTAVEAMKAGALDYILKPFKASAILPVISRALAVRYLRVENAALNRSLRGRTVELEVANKELEAANKELRVFSFLVSHDLRSPLNAIKGYSSILLDQYHADLPTEAQRYLKTIVRSALQMSQLIDDLLRLCSLGLHTLIKEQINTELLVDEVLSEVRNEITDRDVHFSVSQLPDCVGDRALLKQVFVNLLSNAVKFTRQRERAVIEIRCKSGDGEKVYFVRDNGAGFDMQTAGSLFGDFRRLHSQTEFEGTGVGLSIVRRIIERHGGRVWAEAEVDKGAAFFFVLPD